MGPKTNSSSTNITSAADIVMSEPWLIPPHRCYSPPHRVASLKPALPEANRLVFTSPSFFLLLTSSSTISHTGTITTNSETHTQATSLSSHHHLTSRIKHLLANVSCHTSICIAYLASSPSSHDRHATNMMSSPRHHHHSCHFCHRPNLQNLLRPSPNICSGLCIANTSQSRTQKVASSLLTTITCGPSHVKEDMGFETIALSCITSHVSRQHLLPITPLRSHTQKIASKMPHRHVVMSRPEEEEVKENEEEEEAFNSFGPVWLNRSKPDQINLNHFRPNRFI